MNEKLIILVSFLKLNFFKFFIILILTFSFNCSSENADKKNNEKFLTALTLNQLSTTSRTCDDTAPAFSTLKDAGFDSSCGRSGCHDGTTEYDSEVYTEVKGLTTPGSPSRSSLFTEQSSGSMKQYTTSNLDDAIYCWVKGGSNP
jgi:hypothetical protein